MRALSTFTLGLALVVTAGCNRGTTEAPAPAPAPVPGGDTGKPVPGGETTAPTMPTTPTSAPSGGGQTQNYNGNLAGGDMQLTSGEYYDTYTIQVQAGQAITVDLNSSAFDPYIILKAPSGAQEENDDYNGSRTRSRLESVAAESGAYSVMATTYQPGESGDYALTVTTGGAAPAGAVPAPPPSGGK